MRSISGSWTDAAGAACLVPGSVLTGAAPDVLPNSSSKIHSAAVVMATDVCRRAVRQTAAAYCR
jgi:hypothetical protein